MKIKIRGSSKRITNDEVARAIKFFVWEICPRQFDKLSIQVDMASGLLKNSECYGKLLKIDEEQNPKMFALILDNDLARTRIIRTIAHEVVHIKQYATGVMRDLQTGKVSWKYSRKGRAERFSTDGVDFWQPWEVEARGMEEGLLAKYESFNQLYERL